MASEIRNVCLFHSFITVPLSSSITIAETRPNVWTEGPQGCPMPR